MLLPVVQFFFLLCAETVLR